MAHDYHGEELKVGDLVLVAAVVKEIDGDEEGGSNITIETLHPSFPHPHKGAYAINSHQVERVDLSEEDAPDAEVPEPQVTVPEIAAPVVEETAPEAPEEPAVPLDAPVVPEDVPASLDAVETAPDALPEQPEDAPADAATPEAAEEHP